MSKITEEDMYELEKALERKSVEITEVNGEGVILVKDFAYLTRRTAMSIYKLASDGNRIRRLRTIKICGYAFIPVMELLEFPFTTNAKGVVFTYTPELYVDEMAQRAVLESK